MYAYSELYLDKAMTSLGAMLHFAVYDAGYGIEDFYDMFIASGLSDAFGKGEPKYTVGMSGVELAYEVIRRIEDKECKSKPVFQADRSPEYWAGWALAYYQWRSGRSFRFINEFARISDIVLMYSPYHEMDITQFADEMERKLREHNMLTRLKVYRDRLGLSQRELAERSGVSVRMIQNYEQRRKDINKAQGDTLLMLARALYCEIEELLEAV